MRRYYFTKLVMIIKNNEKSLLILTIILLSILFNFTWFDDECIVAGVDFFPPIDAHNYIKRTLFIWDPTISGGMPAFLDISKIIPFILFWAFFESLGLDIVIIQRLWFVGIYTFSILSMYYFVSTLFPELRFRIARIISSLFYLFNAYIGLSTNRVLSESTALAYIFTPFLLGIFIRCLNLYDERKIKHVIIFVLALLLMSTSVANFPSYIAFWILLLSFFLYEITKNKNKTINYLQYIALVLILLILTNLWWVVPLIFSISEKDSNITLSKDISLKWVVEKSEDSSFLNVFRLFGKWSFDDGVYINGKFYLYHPQYPMYTKFPLLFITFLVPILAFSALLFRPKDRRVLFLSILAVIFIFLAKGMHPPLELINELLYKYIPGFIIYRDPPTKFLPLVIFCYSILIGITINEIYHYLARNRKLTNLKHALLALITVLVLLNGWPVITGDVIHPEGGFHDAVLENLKGFQAKIPSYWFEAGAWINSKEEDFRVLLTPQNPFLSVHYDWYLGVDRTPKFIYKPLVTVYPKGLYVRNEMSLGLAQKIYNEIKSNSTNIEKLLSIFNVKYILQRNDLDWTYFGNPKLTVSSPTEIKQILSSKEGIKFVKSFGKLDIYEVDDQFFVPHIYIATNILFIDRNISIENPWIVYRPNITWRIQRGVLEEEGDILYISSNVSTSIISSKLNISSNEYPYLLLKFKTDNETAIVVQINPETCQRLPYKGYLYALNREKAIVKNIYNSQEWHTLAFRLYKNTTVYKIKIRIIPNPKYEETYEGKKLHAWINSVIFAKSISFSETLIKMIESQNFSVGKSVVLLRNKSYKLNINLYELPSVKDNITTTFKKINPTKYIVSVENATQPFFLVFSESYHPQWKIYVEDKPMKFNKIVAEYSHVNVKEAEHDWYKFTPEDIIFLFKKPAVNETYHFKANGYANAWYIDPKEFDKDGDGKFTMTIYFLPQSLFYLGLFISGTTLFGCIGYLFYDWRKEKGDKWTKRIEELLKVLLKRLKIRKTSETKL